MIILGVTHPISYNTAACLLIDGRLIAFAEEERFTRLKHAPQVYPERAVEFCLRYAGVKPADVDATAVGFVQPEPGAVTPEAIARYVAGTLPVPEITGLKTHVKILSTDL